MTLLLAGTGEGRRLAEALAAESIPAIASRAGATRQPEPLGLRTRTGGFGGEGPFRDYLASEGISAVLDATHPFAHRISRRTARVCAELGLPYCQLLRPAWAPEPGDLWTLVDREEDVAELVAPGDVVFLATGRQTLERFSALFCKRLFCRQIDPPTGAFPFANGAYLVGRPPFSVEDEMRLFSDLDIDWLVVKNAGGAASKTKLTAARLLGIRVAMIARPEQPEGQKVETVGEALAWARTHGAPE